jgi:hypothetical protein
VVAAASPANGTYAGLACGFGVGISTVYRYIREALLSQPGRRARRSSSDTHDRQRVIRLAEDQHPVQQQHR